MNRATKLAGRYMVMLVMAGAGFPGRCEEVPSGEAVVELTLFAGDMQVVEGEGITDVAVGDSSVVNAAALAGRGLLITAREPGETTLRLWRKGAQQVYHVLVVDENLQRHQRELQRLLMDIPGVRIFRAGARLAVDAAAVSSAERARIHRVLTAYPTVVNLLPETGAGPEQMVYMDVRIIELSRKGLSHLGVDWADGMAGPVYAAAGDVHKSVGIQKGLLSEATAVPAGARLSPFQSYFGMATRLDSRINLLEQSGDAQMVAHPVLSCRNEGKASFLSGGQVPFATASATGTPSVEFKDYGIKLDIEPVLGEGNTVFARIAAEVSDLDHSTAINNVPGLLSRRTETEFSMKLGETIVLSGLVNKVSGKDTASVPGLGRIPVLGRFFSSRTRSSRRTELVILVTPLVNEGSPAEFGAAARRGQGLVDGLAREAELFKPADSGAAGSDAGGKSP